jgi:signal transduction histidine kinase
VQGDRGALETLVDNALRYTHAGGVVVRARREGHGALLEVEDTGPGIAPGERHRVFDRFYRGESAPTGGTGLGLAIVKRIAERHGASVELAEGAGGKGLRATVRFP